MTDWKNPPKLFIPGPVHVLPEILEQIERTIITELLSRFEGNQSAVAKKLRIPRTSLRARLRKLNMEQ